MSEETSKLERGEMKNCRVKKIRRAIFFASAALFVAGVFFTPFSRLVGRQTYASGPTHVSLPINQPAVWTKENSPYLVSGFIEVNAPLTIEAGTIVKFGRNGGLAIRKDFRVNGTSDEKVVFTSVRDDSSTGWGYLLINTPKDGEMRIRYAELRHSTLGFYIFSAAEGMSIKYCDIRENGFGIWAYNPDLTIEKNIITKNVNAGIRIEAGLKTVTAVANAIYDNEVGAEVLIPAGKSFTHTVLKAEGNWWGDESGPQNAANPDGEGDSVSGLVSFNPWLAENPVATPDPAIIIPGIMGSWEKDGAWQIDPIFHTYDDLISAFISAGYANDGKEMSVFPYEWRDSNIENAKLLHQRIQQIKADTGRPKVDIVAHSMGGLLARQYIESGDFENDVDQLITLGTPHLGAPKDYVTWEAGEFTGPWGFAFRRIINHEAEENGYSNIFDYIHNRPMDSVQELLPNYNYLFEKKKNYALRETYPSNYPENNFLDKLNSENKTKLLDGLEFYNVIGELSGNQSTILGFNIIDSDNNKTWEHGYPENFWFVLGSRGFVRNTGDGTVPLYSAEASNIPFDKTTYLQSEHNALPTDAQQDILEILTGRRPNAKIDEWQIDNILIGQIFSPIDFQIVSPSGKRLGKNFETGGEYNEIPGAYYTGSDTDTEFIVIPNPEDGEYQILTQGTGTGDYKIEIAKISEDEEKEAEESTATFTGTADPKKEDELKIEIKNDEVKKIEKLTVPEPEKKNAAADQVRTEVYTEVSNSLSGDEPVVQDNQSKIQKLDVLKNDVRQYFKSNQIKKRKTAAEIEKRLAHIRVYLKRYAIGTSLKKINSAKTKANKDIAKLVRYVNKNTPKYITAETRADLIEKLNNLRID